MNANSQTHVISHTIIQNRNKNVSDVISSCFFPLSLHPSQCYLLFYVLGIVFLFRVPSYYCFLCIRFDFNFHKMSIEWRDASEMRRAKKGKNKNMCVICSSEGDVCGDNFEWYVDGIQNIEWKRLRCVQLCLKSLLVLNLQPNFYTTTTNFTHSLCIWDPSSRGERGIHNCNPWSVSNVNSNE